jgi:predicted porin
MLYWSLLEADVLGPGLYGTGSLDAYIPNSRADNAVAYRGSFDGLTVGATYSLGRDAVNAGSAAGTNCAGELANDASACREWSALLKWDAAAWGAALAWDEIRGGPGALFGLNSSSLKDSRLSANGYAKWGDFKASLGLVRRDNKASGTTPRSDLWYLGAAWSAAPGWVVDGELLRLSFKHGDAATLLALRATYSLSKRTALYGQWAHIGNGGSLAISVSAGAGGSAPVPGGGQSAYALGLRHAF